MKKASPLNKRKILIIVAVFVLFVAVVASVSTTISYYIKKSNEFNGTTFTAAESKTPKFTLDSKDNTITDVCVNVGKTEYPVFVRVSVIINWKYVAPVGDSDTEETDGTASTEAVTDEKDGTIWYAPPKKTDYTVEFNDKDWMLVAPEQGTADNLYGYYYYKLPVLSEDTTTALIKSFKMNDVEPPEKGYVMSVEFIVQTIQAVGATDGTDATDDTESIPAIPAWQDAGWKGDAWVDFTKS